MSNIKAIEEVPYGVFVWYTNDDRPVTNEDGDFMVVPVNNRHDKAEVKRRIDGLRRLADHYGVGDGKPVYMSGSRLVSNDEYESQKARMDAGLVPDPFDLGAIKDEMKAIKEGKH